MPPTPKTESPKAQSPFQNLSSPETLAKLNSHLQSNSYIDGYSPSHLDLTVHVSVPKPVLSSYPHVNRWYQHISAIGSSIQVWLWCTGFASLSMSWSSHFHPLCSSMCVCCHLVLGFSIHLITFLFQKKEPVGDDVLPDGLEESMASMSLTGDQLKPLSVNQIKKVSTLMDKAIAETNKKLDETEKERNAALREMGNHLHPSVHVSDNEVIFPQDSHIFLYLLIKLDDTTGRKRCGTHVRRLHHP